MERENYLFGTNDYIDYGTREKGEEKVCKYCGKTYDDVNIYKCFCSYTCRTRWRRENEKDKELDYEN